MSSGPTMPDPVCPTCKWVRIYTSAGWWCKTCSARTGIFTDGEPEERLPMTMKGRVTEAKDQHCSAGRAELFQRIDARLADLREANDVYRKASWDRPSDIQRNDREIHWLEKFKALIPVEPQGVPDREAVAAQRVRVFGWFSWSQWGMFRQPMMADEDIIKTE